MKKRLLRVFITVLLLSFSFCLPVFAHSGGVDSNGGHYDSSTGEYHYHHGYSAHQHYDINGDGTIDCPYESTQLGITASKATSTSKIITPAKNEPETWDITLWKFLSIPLFLIAGAARIVVFYGVVTIASLVVSWIKKEPFSQKRKTAAALASFATVLSIFIIGSVISAYDLNEAKEHYYTLPYTLGASENRYACSDEDCDFCSGERNVNYHDFAYYKSVKTKLQLSVIATLIFTCPLVITIIRLRKILLKERLDRLSRFAGNPKAQQKMIYMGLDRYDADEDELECLEFYDSEDSQNSNSNNNKH